MKSLSAAVGFLLLLAIAVPSFAGDPIRATMEPIARELIVELKKQKIASVAVGTFSGPEDLKSNFGPGISNTLTELLNKMKAGIVDPAAKYSIVGRYDKVLKLGKEVLPFDAPNAEDGTLVVSVTAQVVDENGQLVDAAVAEGKVEVEKKIEVARDVKDNSAIASILGLTISLPTLANPGTQNSLLVQKVTMQAGGAFIDQAKVRPRQGSPYAVEVLAAPINEAPDSPEKWNAIAPRQPRFEDGEPYIDLEEDEVYVLRVYNQDVQDAATIVEIDGLSVFAFTSGEFRLPSGEPKYKFYIVEKGEGQDVESNSRLITGWHQTNQEVQSFLVTAYGKGVSAQPVPSSGKTGTITVSFAGAWNDLQPPPPEALAKRGPVETGLGPVVRSNQKEAKRTVGRFNDIVTIRYTR